MTPDKLHYVSELRLSLFNGIGTMLVGHMKDPDMAPWVWKQYAFCVFFVPVYLGRFYVVRPGKRGFEIAGWLSGAEFEAHYGPRVYWTARLRGYLLPLVMFGMMGLVVAGVFIFAPLAA
jgi:hypothetical protein